MKNYYCISKIKILGLGLILIHNSCSSNRPVSSAEIPPMKKAQLLAKEEIGEDFECKFNTNETFILCWSINKEAQQDKPLKYFVYEISEEQIIHENVIPRGDVDWTSESEILVKTIPGLLKEDESLRDYSYVFDVKRKTKINKKRP